MTINEKLELLEELERKITKLQKKAYRLIGQLKSNEEFDSRFSSIQWSEDGIEHFGEWFRSEISHQRKKLLKKEKEMTPEEMGTEIWGEMHK